MGARGMVDGVIEKGRHPQYALENWAISFGTVIDHCITKAYTDWPKPEWFCQDETWKKLTKLALEMFRADAGSHLKLTISMSAIHAFVLSGIVSDGAFRSSATIPVDRTVDELLEAAACIKISTFGENRSVY